MDHEGHVELLFENCRVPASNLIANDGDGFAISQARLGPGRIHHCMRSIGAAERALELLCKRALSRTTFGKRIAERSNIMDWIAESRIDLEMVRLLTLKTAWMMDNVGNKAAAVEISAIKVAAPNVACGSSTGRCRCTARAASATTGRWHGCTRINAHCAWPTAPTRCTR